MVVWVLLQHSAEALDGSRPTWESLRAGSRPPWLAILRVFFSRIPFPGSPSFRPVSCREPGSLAVSLGTQSQCRALRSSHVPEFVLQPDVFRMIAVASANHGVPLRHGFGPVGTVKQTLSCGRT